MNSILVSGSNEKPTNGSELQIQQRKRKLKDEENSESSKPTVQYPFNNSILLKTDILRTHKVRLPERAQYPCDQCDYVATRQVNMNVCVIHVISVTILLHNLDI